MLWSNEKCGMSGRQTATARKGIDAENKYNILLWYALCEWVLREHESKSNAETRTPEQSSTTIDNNGTPIWSVLWKKRNGFRTEIFSHDRRVSGVWLTRVWRTVFESLFFWLRAFFLAGMKMKLTKRKEKKRFRWRFLFVNRRSKNGQSCF